MTYVVVAVISRLNTNSEEEFLLASSKSDFGEFTGCYYPPSGHVEIGETEEGALRRELQEELALELKGAKRICELPGDLPDEICCFYKCSVDMENLIVNKDELDDVGFFTIAEINNLKLWPLTKRFFENYASHL